MFDAAALTQAVQKALSVPDAVPAGRRGAFVTVASADGVQAVVAAKLDQTWTVSASVDHPWTGGLDYGVQIHGSW